MKNQTLSSLFIPLFLLSAGCSDGTSAGASEHEFAVYNIPETATVCEYGVYDSEQTVIAYYPIVTNKKITASEAGGIAAVLHPEKTLENDTYVSLKLKPREQNQLNHEYKSYFISFVEYRIDVRNAENLSFYNHIDVCDTKIWIYHNEEYQTVEFNDVYLKINVVQNPTDVFSPDWETILENTKRDIQRKLDDL